MIRADARRSITSRIVGSSSASVIKFSSRAWRRTATDPSPRWDNRSSTRRAVACCRASSDSQTASAEWLIAPLSLPALAYSASVNQLLLRCRQVCSSA